jgi:hypothetical protein
MSLLSRMLPYTCLSPTDSPPEHVSAQRRHDHTPETRDYSPENNSSPTELLGAMIRAVDLQTFPANINYKAGAVAINRLHHPPARNTSVARHIGDNTGPQCPRLLPGRRVGSQVDSRPCNGRTIP